MENYQRLIIAGTALYEEQWQTELARDLGLSDTRRIRQWLSGERPVPEGVWNDIAKLLTERQAIIENALRVISNNETGA